jgi:ribonuclease P protein component
MREHAGHQARLGLAIAKKQLPRAVDRNRIKRVVRESFRLLQIQDHDFVVLARRDTVSAENAQLFLSLKLHWARLLKTRISPTSGSPDG